MEKRETALVELVRYTVKDQYKNFPPSFNMELEIVSGSRRGETIWFNGALRTEKQRKRVFDAITALGAESASVKNPEGIGSVRALAVLGTSRSGRPEVSFINRLTKPNPSARGAVEILSGEAVEKVATLVDATTDEIPF